MVPIIIIGSVLLFLLIICLIPAGLRIKYNGEFYLYGDYGLIKIKLIPKKKKIKISDYSEKKMKKREEKQKKKLAKSEKKSAAKGHKFNKPAEKSDNVLTASLKDPDRRFDMISQLYDILTVVISEFAAILKIKLFKLHVVVGSPEPSKTAILYGGACAAAGNLVNLIGQYTDIEKSNKNSVYVVPDFIAEKTTASADVSVTLSIGGIIVFLFKIRKIIKKVLKLLQEDK